MHALGLSEWVAVYGAVLSTLLAIGAFVAWLRSGARLSVIAFHPLDYRGKSEQFGFVISNCGTEATVISQISAAFFDGTCRFGGLTFKEGKLLGRATFNQKTPFDPSRLPVRSSNDNDFPSARVLQPGNELMFGAKPIKDHDPRKHWIKVSATTRNSSRNFSGWAKPILNEGEN